MADVELLPLPEWTKRDDLGGLVASEVRVEMHAYARANVAHHTAALRAEVERLRRLAQERDTMLGKRLCAGTNADGKPRCIVLAEERARAERLAEALRELVDVFSKSGMYDDEVFDKARAALGREE